MAIPRTEWKQKLLAEFGEYMCERFSLPPKEALYNCSSMTSVQGFQNLPLRRLISLKVSGGCC